MKPLIVLLLASAATSLSAHVMVSPPQSTQGATQKYELRVHNEAKVADGHTWTGAISDKMCGGDHKKMGGKLSDRECTLACTKGGAPYVLVASGKVFQLGGHEDDLRTHAGHEVTVTGELNGDTIKVSKVEIKTVGK